MHLSNLFLQNMLCEKWKTSKNFCIEVHLASMIAWLEPYAPHYALRFLKLSSE